MFRVNRLDFLAVLESVQPGLSSKDIIDQSASFAFRNGQVATFNDEVAVRSRSPLPKDFVGAVQAKPLLELLRQMPDQELMVGPLGDAEDGIFHVRSVNEDENGKKAKRRRKTGVRMDAEILLPMGAVKKPDEWNELPEGWVDALRLVHECCGRDESMFVTTCVHIRPDAMEATDRFKAMRYRMDTGFPEPILIRRTAARPLIVLEPDEFALSDGWVHFRNRPGEDDKTTRRITYSCRLYLEEFPDVDGLLGFSGQTVRKLPKGLAEAAKLAGTFSGETKDNNQVLVELTDELIRVSGEGSNGFAIEELQYRGWEGRPTQFKIAPAALTEIVTRYRECEIGPDKLKVEGGDWTFVTCLGRPGKPATAADDRDGETADVTAGEGDDGSSSDED